MLYKNHTSHSVMAVLDKAESERIAINVNETIFKHFLVRHL